MTKRRVTSFSTCNTAKLAVLDFRNWFQDNSVLGHNGNCYIHVRHMDGETWHRVHPRKINGKEVKRLAVNDSILYWLYDDKTKTEREN